MKIVLVNPTNKLRYKMLWPDLGLGYLATALKRAHHEVRIIDLDLEVYLGKLTYESAIQALTKIEADVIGFKILNLDLPFVREATAAIKQKNPRVTLIAGGPGTLLKTFIFKHLPDLDFAFLGEAENSLPAFLAKINEPSEYEQIPGLIWREGDVVRHNPMDFIDDLDSAGPIDWEALQPSRYPIDYTGESKFPLMVTRGCPFHCRYCQSTVLHGNQVRSRSMESVVDEIRFLKHRFGISNIHLTDDNITVIPQISREFPQNLLESDVKIRWRIVNGIRLDTMTKDVIRLFEKSGCYYLYVALESGAQRVLDLMDRHTNLEIMIDSVHEIHDYSNIKMLGYVMLGFPGETAAEAMASIRLTLRLPLERAAYLTFTPLPDTPAFYDLKKNRLLNSYNIENFHQYGDSPKFNYSSWMFNYIRFRGYLSFYSRPRVAYQALRAVCHPRQIPRTAMRAYSIVSRK